MSDRTEQNLTGAPPGNVPAGAPGSRFEDLNAIVLSIEWEISDETMSRFVGEVDRLKKLNRQDKVIYSCLQLLGSVGNYVKTKKASAHPDSISLLHSVHQVLNQAYSAGELSQAERVKIVAEEVKKFKALKAELLRSRSDADPAPKPAAPPAPTPADRAPKAEVTPPVPGEEPARPAKGSDPLLDRALEEIKHLIRAEFDALRDEIRQLRSTP